MTTGMAAAAATGTLTAVTGTLVATLTSTGPCLATATGASLAAGESAVRTTFRSAAAWNCATRGDRARALGARGHDA